MKWFSLIFVLPLLLGGCSLGDNEPQMSNSDALSDMVYWEVATAGGIKKFQLATAYKGDVMVLYEYNIKYAYTDASLNTQNIDLYKMSLQGLKEFSGNSAAVTLDTGSSNAYSTGSLRVTLLSATAVKIAFSLTGKNGVADVDMELDGYRPGS